MARISYLLHVVTAILLLSGCNGKNNPAIDTKQQANSSAVNCPIEIKYAQGFSVSSFENYHLVEIHDPQQDNSTVYKYALTRRGANPHYIPADYTVIEIPLKSVICMTTLQLANFIKLDAIDKIVGLTSTHYLFNEKVNKRIKDKQISQIGIEGNFDKEVILALNPDVILVSPFKRGGYESIKDLDVPLLTYLGYKETTALGQAEWLKFTGLLIGQEEKANKLFEEIATQYEKLRQLAQTATTRPTVLSGEMRSGVWYVVGGKNFLAEQFRDAGADYFLKNDEDTGGKQLDYESVYSQGANADFWRMLVIHDGDYSYEVLKQSDARYTDFKAYKDKKVVCCNLRQKPYYEKAPVEPEVILADLIKAFHPELLPDYQPVYYEILK